MSQSKSARRAKPVSRGAKSSGGANETRGNSIGVAPNADRRCVSSELCAAARVMTTCLPARGDAPGSGTRAAHFFENGLSTRFDQEPRHLLAEFGRLFGGTGGALLNVLRAVDGADASVEDEFRAFDACPRAERNLAATLKRCEQGAFSDDRSARFGVVELGEEVGGFVVMEAGFNRDGALSYGG